MTFMMRRLRGWADKAGRVDRTDRAGRADRAGKVDRALKTILEDSFNPSTIINNISI